MLAVYLLHLSVHDDILPIFSISTAEYSWQTLSLFLDLIEFQTHFSFITDDVVNLLRLCNYLMVTQRFISWLFSIAITNDVLLRFERNHIVEIIYTLKECHYISVAHNLIRHASDACNEIFHFDDLMDSRSLLDFERSVNRRLFDEES